MNEGAPHPDGWDVQTYGWLSYAQGVSTVEEGPAPIRQTIYNIV
jgi:hypothetical protein